MIVCLTKTLPVYPCPPSRQVIQENLGIAHGCITTIHNVTGTQPIIDMAMTKKKVGCEGEARRRAPAVLRAAGAVTHRHHGMR